MRSRFPVLLMVVTVIAMGPTSQGQSEDRIFFALLDRSIPVPTNAYPHAQVIARGEDRPTADSLFLRPQTPYRLWIAAPSSKLLILTEFTSAAAGQVTEIPF